MAKVDALVLDAPLLPGNQTLTFPALAGLQIKAILTLLVRTDLLQTESGHAELSIGASDGVNNYGFTYATRTNQGTTDTRCRNSDTHCIIVIQINTGNINGTATVTSFNIGTITLNWDDAPGNAWKYIIIAWAGDEVEASLDTFLTSSAEGGSTTVTPGFPIDNLFVFGTGTRFTFNGNDYPDSRCSFGFGRYSKATKQISQTCYGFLDVDGVDSSNLDTRVHISDQHILAHIGTGTLGAGEQEDLFKLENVTDTSFDITRDSVVEKTGVYACLSLNTRGNLDSAVTLYNPPTTAEVEDFWGTDLSEYDDAFRPSVAVYIGTPDELLNTGVGGARSQSHSLGIIKADAAGGGLNASYGCYRVQVDGNTDAQSYYDTAIGVNLFNGTVSVSGQPSSFLNDKFGAIYNKVAAVDYLWPMYVFGENKRRVIKGNIEAT
jgi:hypothetical protein